MLFSISTCCPKQLPSRLENGDYTDVFAVQHFVFHSFFNTIPILGTTKKSFAAFELSDYDQVPIKTILTNNGHTAKLSSTYSTFTPTGMW